MLRASYVWRWSAVFAACVWLAWAGTSIARRGYAEIRARSSHSPAELERACAADPGHASCWARLAEAREALGEDAAPAWQKALALDPRNASVLTQAALAAESRGDLQSAERLLLQASHYNHLWLPRWTLANFYYRHNRAEFWPSVRSALERSHGDPTAVFRLCRDAGAGPHMLDRVLPPTPVLLKAYVEFLIREGEIDDLPAAADRYARLTSGPESVATLLAAAESLIAAEQISPALAIWNDLAARRHIPYPPWSAPSPLVNPQLQTPLKTPAFDWKTPQTTEIIANFGTPPGGVKISLSGRQPENAEILVQSVVIQPQFRYQFSFEYRTPGIAAADSALYWSVLDTRSKVLTSNDWEPVWVRFESPAGPLPRLAKLALIAGRKPGRARIQGEIWVRNLRLEAY